MSEKRLKEFANIETLDVVEITLQEGQNLDRLRRVAGRCGEKNAQRSCCRRKQ